HVSGYGCGSCSNGPIGESKIVDILDIHAFTYIRNYRPDNFPGRAFYDFYIMGFPIDNDEHEVLVEFDGPQHYKYTPYLHETEEVFLKSQKRDIIKTLWAIANGYRVIRIAYTKLHKLEDVLLDALASEDKLYLSDPELY